MASLADTSFVIAVVVQSDSHYQSCRQILSQEQKVYITQSALTEIAYLLRRERGNIMVANFMSGLRRSKYELVSLQSDDLNRAADLLKQYADSRVDFVDASIVAVLNA